MPDDILSPRTAACVAAFRDPGTAGMDDVSVVRHILSVADRETMERIPMMRDARGTEWVELAALKGILCDKR